MTNLCFIEIYYRNINKNRDKKPHTAYFHVISKHRDYELTDKFSTCRLANNKPGDKSRDVNKYHVARLEPIGVIHKNSSHGLAWLILIKVSNCLRKTRLAKPRHSI